MYQPGELRDSRAALKYLHALGVRISMRTLEEWRRFGRGPAIHRIGGRVFYAESDLVRFVEQSRSQGAHQ